MRFGIIGGSGLYQLINLTDQMKVTVSTPFGDIVCTIGKFGGKEVVFLPRHGEKHTIPPHLINYRANAIAMKRLEVGAVLSTTASGSLKQSLPPKTIVIPDQLLDLTYQRPLTIFDGETAPVVHVDLTYPFCPTLRLLLKSISAAMNVTIVDNACYVCVDGPRYETAFEVQVLSKLGGEVIGMTAGTEAIFFREAEICYATVSIITNWCAGIAPKPLSHSEVEETIKQMLATILSLFERAVVTFDFADCLCRHALDTYGEKARNWLIGKILKKG